MLVACEDPGNVPRRDNFVFRMGRGGGLIFGNLKMFEFLEDAPTPSVDPGKSLMNIEGTVQKHVQDLH